jgi:hypothetical protein
MRYKRFFFPFAWLLTACLHPLAVAQTSADGSLRWDFAASTHDWKGNPRVESIETGEDGWRFRCTGADPWIESPAYAFPTDCKLRVKLCLMSEADNSGELFYGTSFTAGASRTFIIQPDGAFHEYQVILPAIGPEARLRLDPASDEGEITLAWIEIEPLEAIEAPSLMLPSATVTSSFREQASLLSGRLQAVHSGRQWGSFALRHNQTTVATGHDRDLLAVGTPLKWINLHETLFRLTKLPNGWMETVRFRVDAQTVILQRSLRGGVNPGTVDVEVTLSLSGSTGDSIPVLHVPWLNLFPGFGSTGAGKHQAVFPGLEYLANEPSSSKADIESDGYDRRVPDPIKITWPMMGIVQANGTFFSVMWEMAPEVTPVFDSPDRTFNSGAHLFGLWGPGVGAERPEGELFAYAPFTLEAAHPITVRATLQAGTAGHAVDMIKACLQHHPMPDLVELPGGLPEAVELLGRGWLDSGLGSGDQWRHALWNDSFPPAYAADAPMYMQWLADHTADTALANRLQDRAGRALEALRTHQPLMNSAVSHVRLPAPPLLYTELTDYIPYVEAQARRLLADFDETGVRRYTPAPGKPDYARTHFANHANGLSANSLFQALLGAAFSGDPTLIAEAVKVLDLQTQLYYGSVPRGAQTWEMPLHTPDILASAYLIRCYLLGYELTGNQHYLEQAEYWAWTGLPFVYLRKPAEGEVGAYATIAVLGATNWQAPVWFGLPVQWCGLVYSSALFDLAALRPKGPWAQIAKGIARTGLRMTFPSTDAERQGLLPDFYHLQAQVSDGPAINPGTVQANLPGVFDLPPLFTLRRLNRDQILLIAPCDSYSLESDDSQLQLVLRGWKSGPFQIMLSRVDAPPQSVRARTLDSASIAKPLEHDYHPERGHLIIEVPGECELTIAW